MYTFKIIIDKKARDPLTYTGNIVIILFSEGRHIGHHHGYKPSDYNGEDALKKAIKRDRKPTAIYPIYMYSDAGLNSAIALSLNRFERDGKEPTAGYILYYDCTGGSEKKLTKAKRENHLRLFLQTYNRYLNNGVLRYIISDEQGKEVHSEGNYYTRKQAETEAKNKIAYLVGEDSFFKNH